MSLEAILFLCFAFLGANLLDSNFIAPYLGQAGGTLIFHVGGLVAWIIFWLVGRRETPRARQNQFWLTVAFVIVFVGGALVQQMNLRGQHGAPVGIHDGAIQVEVAAKKLLHSENPYQADYRDTNYGILNPSIPGGPSVNVVWSHVIYPPGMILLQASLTMAANLFGTHADVRWIFLVGLAAVSWIAVHLQTDWEKRTRLLLLTAGNPVLWLYVLAGYNDILVVAALGAATLAWSKQHWRWAGVFFGIALGLKQSAWLAIPLLGWMLWQLWLQRPSAARQLLTATVITAGAIFLPFLLWNAGALYDDIIRYASGSIPYSYPISGATLMQYVRVWGLIDSPWQLVSAGWAQLVVGGSLSVVLMRWLGKDLKPGDWLGAVAVLTTAVLLVSRYNNNNYLSAVIGLGVLAYAFRQPTAAK